MGAGVQLAPISKFTHGLIGKHPHHKPLNLSPACSPRRQIEDLGRLRLKSLNPTIGRLHHSRAGQFQAHPIQFIMIVNVSMELGESLIIPAVRSETR